MNAVRRSYTQTRDQLVRIEGVRDLPVTAPPHPDRADELAALVHEDMPWTRDATTTLWHALKLSWERGDVGLRIKPILLLGDGGVGKSYWARHIARLLGMPFLKIDATQEPAAWSVIGMQRGWNSGEPGRVLGTILDTRNASPLVFMDEIEKAGRPSSASGIDYSATNALLPLLEPSTARHWTCPYFRVEIDMSCVAWVLAANSLNGLEPHFRSRLTIIRISNPTPDELVTFCQQEGRRRGLGDAAIDAAAEAVRRQTMRRPTTLRDVLRRLDHAELLERQPMRQ